MQITPIPLNNNSVSRSNALLAPLANTVFLTIPASDLPSGYYQFDTTIGIAPNQGSGNGALADTRNFRIAIDGYPEFTPQALLNNSVRQIGYANLNGSQGVTLKVGNVNASASMIYSIATTITKIA